MFKKIVYAINMLHRTLKLKKSEPKSLFKYMDIEGFEKSLETQSIKLTQPYLCNDPFDMNLPLPKQNVDDSSGAKEWCKEFQDSPDNFSKNGNNLGVYCLSETSPDSEEGLLLWAHYSNSGKGVCLEFDTDLLLNELGFEGFKYEKYFDTKKDFRVEYENVFPVMRGLWDGDTLVIDNKYNFYCLFKKSKIWEYEKEWRLLFLKLEDNKQRRTKFLEEFIPTNSLSYKELAEELQNKIQAYLNFYNPIKYPNNLWITDFPLFALKAIHFGIRYEDEGKTLKLTNLLGSPELEKIEKVYYKKSTKEFKLERK